MKKLIMLLIILSVFIAIGYFWWTNGLSAIDPSSKTYKIFVIQKGKGIREIANALKKENFIKDPVVFFLLVKKLGLDGKIQAGDFRLSYSMTAEEIAQNLTHGTLDIWVTIPEGKRAEEIAEILKEKVPTYEPAWNSVLTQNEGFLFPDTYLIPRDADLNLVVSLMKDNFRKKYAEIKKNNTNQFSDREIVIMASLIEREARFDQDRPLIASVIVNRLKLSMPLQIDATIQYALGYQPQEKSWWKKHLISEDLKINSLYNTYNLIGLPPDPIANPGSLALSAAINPSQTDYLYYFSDRNGHTHYAKTLTEHNENIKKYQP